MKQSSGILLLVLAAMIWGLSFVAQTVSTSFVGPWTFNGIRFFLGFLTLLPFVLKRKESLRGQWKHTLFGAFCCGLVLSIASVLQQSGMASTSTGKAGFITSLYILIVPFLSLFLGKKITLKHWLCVLLALFGMYLLCGTSEGGFGKGELLVLACAFCFAIHILVIDHFKETDGIALSAFQFLFAGIISLCFMPMEHPEAGAIKQIIVPILYSGIMSCGVAYTLQVIGQKIVEPSKAVMPLSLESVFSTIFGFLILKQSLTVYELLGCVIVFASVILCQMEFPKKRQSIT